MRLHDLFDDELWTRLIAPQEHPIEAASTLPSYHGAEAAAMAEQTAMHSPEGEAEAFPLRSIVDRVRGCSQTFAATPRPKRRHIVGIGPGRNLGAGIAFRYLGADSYTGIEMHVGADFNTRPTLATIEALVRLKYVDFVSNFNAEPLGFSGDGALSDNPSLENFGISLIQPQSLSTLALPDESADFLYSNFTFEHIQRPDEMAARSPAS
jgi:hypothetical protein